MKVLRAGIILSKCKFSEKKYNLAMALDGTLINNNIDRILQGVVRKIDAFNGGFAWFHNFV